MTMSARPKAIHLHQNIVFGIDGNDAPFLGDGWADAKVGCRWTRGDISEIRMIHPGFTDVLLEIETFNLSEPPVDIQQIELLANSVLVGKFVLQDGHRNAMHIEANMMPEAETLTLHFVHLGREKLDAVSRVPNKLLGVCFLNLKMYTVQPVPFKRLLGRGKFSQRKFVEGNVISIEAIRDRFYGLDKLSEIVLMGQRRGAIASDSMSPMFVLSHLLQEIDSAFAVFGLAGFSYFEPPPDDAIDLSSSKHNSSAGTASSRTNDADKPPIFPLERDFRVRDLIQVLTQGNRIFVVLSEWFCPILTEQDVLSLLIALNRHSTNRLLWVAQANADNPPGSVQQKVPSLLQGWIDNYDRDWRPGDALTKDWIEVCTNVMILEAELQAREENFTKRINNQSFSFDQEQVRSENQRLFELVNGRYIGLEEHPRRQTLLSSRARATDARSLLQDDEISDLPVVVHVKGRGDVSGQRESPYSSEVWAGYRGSRLALEGFAIIDRGDIPDNAVTYQVLNSDGSLSRLFSIGDYAGTRGLNKEIFGFVLHVSEKYRHAMDIKYEAAFVDGKQSIRFNSGCLCKGDTPAAVEAVRFFIIDKIGFVGDWNLQN